MRLPKTNPNSTTGATLNPSTSLFSQNLDEVIAKLNKIAALIQQINAGGVNGGSNPFAGNTSTGTALAPVTSGTMASLGGGGGASAAISGTASGGISFGGGGFSPIPSQPGMTFTPGMGLGASAFGALGVQGVTSYLNFQTNQTLNGGYDSQGAAGGMGRMFGGAIGGVAGLFLGGPLGAAAGVTAGAAIGDALGRYINAPQAARDSASVAIAPIVGNLQGPGYSVNNNYFTQGFSRLADTLNNGPLAGIRELQTSAGVLGATFGSIASSLNAGGVNPFSAGDSVSMTVWPQAGRDLYNFGMQTARDGVRSAGPLGASNAWLGIGMAAIGAGMRTSYNRDETLAETYTRRLSTLYGKDAPDVAKGLSPIFASLPETGGNTADILKQFGPQPTLDYLRLQNDDLSSSVSPDALRSARAGMGSAERAARMGSLQARGSGAAIASAYGAEMDAIAGLPGGSSSVAYAEANSKRRDATAVAFQQAQDTRYGIPAAQLEGDYQRQALLPFSGTNQLTLGIRNITLNRQRIADLTTYEGQRRAKGDLSEEEELSLTRQIEGAKTAVAAGVATLSEGMENRLPALAAGKGTTFGRYSSLQLAAYYNKLIGSPVRSFGATDSDQLRSQDQVFGNSGVSAQPYSQTSALNNGGGNGSVDRMVEILAQILGEMRRGGNVSGRSGAGQAYGEIGQKDLGADRLWDQRN